MHRKETIPANTKVFILSSDTSENFQNPEDILKKLEYIGQVSQDMNLQRKSSFSGYASDVETSSSSSTTQDKKPFTSKKSRKSGSKNFDAIKLNKLNRLLFQEMIDETKQLLLDLKQEVLSKLDQANSSPPNYLAQRVKSIDKVFPKSNDKVQPNTASKLASGASLPESRSFDTSLSSDRVSMIANVGTPESSVEALDSHVSDLGSVKSFQTTSLMSPGTSQDSISDPSVNTKTRRYPDGVLKEPRSPAAEVRFSTDRHVQFAANSPPNSLFLSKKLALESEIIPTVLRRPEELQRIPALIDGASTKTGPRKASFNDEKPSQKTSESKDLDTILAQPGQNDAKLADLKAGHESSQSGKADALSFYRQKFLVNDSKLRPSDGKPSYFEVDLDKKDSVAARSRRKSTSSIPSQRCVYEHEGTVFYDHRAHINSFFS